MLNCYVQCSQIRCTSVAFSFFNSYCLRSWNEHSSSTLAVNFIILVGRLMKLARRSPLNEKEKCRIINWNNPALCACLWCQLFQEAVSNTSRRDEIAFTTTARHRQRLLWKWSRFILLFGIQDITETLRRHRSRRRDGATICVLRLAVTIYLVRPICLDKEPGFSSQ